MTKSTCSIPWLSKGIAASACLGSERPQDPPPRRPERWRRDPAARHTGVVTPSGPASWWPCSCRSRCSGRCSFRGSPCVALWRSRGEKATGHRQRRGREGGRKGESEGRNPRRGTRRMHSTVKHLKEVFQVTMTCLSGQRHLSLSS